MNRSSPEGPHPHREPPEGRDPRIDDTDADHGSGEEAGPGAEDAVRSPRAIGARLAVLVALLAAATVVTVLVGVPDLGALRSSVAAAGPAAPAVFVLIYAAASLAPLPKNVLGVLAGLLFGLPVGTLVVLLAAMLGSTAAYGLGRGLGRDAVEKITGTRIARVDALLRRRGILAITAVRLVPVLPFTAINYAAGLTAVRTRDYLIGTAVGILPGTVAYVALGAYGTSPGSWPFLVAALALLALTAVGAVLARRRRRQPHG